MDVILNLAGLAIGLFLLFCPIIALVLALDARNRVTALEQTAGELKEMLARLSQKLTDELDRPRATPSPMGNAVEFANEVGRNKPAQAGVSGKLDGEMPETVASRPYSGLRQSLNSTALPPNGEGLGGGRSNGSAASDLTPAVSNSPPEQPYPAIITANAPETEPLPRKNTRLDAWLAEAEELKSPYKPIPEWVGKIKAWLFGGNLVAKVGLLILFLGVSFLLKYAAARVSIPIEYRLVGIVLADIALLLWGWRIRESRPAISLPVQGAAIAILMLVSFGAYKLYGLFPGGVAFALLLVLTAFTCLLAVLQDAVWLAVFGIAGGFAAPILTATGGSSPISLFSYYAMLNAGILAIALYRSWRLLNLVGFAFTFIIGTAWGVLRYTPEHYLSTQLFLLLFFVFYVLLTLLYAARQAPHLKHYVDGTLVFGTPLVAFGLQYGLVKAIPFGLAYSALGLGLFYLASAVLLWQRRGTTLKLLAESFLALGLVFGTLTIPFALDGRWTSAAWALEGAGMVWVGLRQRQTLAWVFGLLVQFGAWLSFLGTIAGLDPASALQSNLWLGFLLLAGTAFLMAINFRKQSGAKHPVDFARFATLFLAFAAIWMLAGAWTEIALRTAGALQANLLASSGLLVAVILSVIAWRMQWQIARGFALFAQILAGLVFLCLVGLSFTYPAETSRNLFSGPFLGALLIGLGAFFSAWFFHRQDELELSQLSKRLLLWAGFWWFGFVLHAWADWLQSLYRLLLDIEPYRGYGLFWCAYGLSLALSSLVLALLAGRLRWPALRWSGVPAWLGLGVSTLAILWCLTIIERLPYRETWLAYGFLWGAGECLMAYWRMQGWIVATFWQRGLHTLRTTGPWLMIWPVGHRLLADWLGSGTLEQEQLLAEGGWFTSGSWARYLPAWMMMLAIVWVIRQTRSGGWPVYPLAGWYRRVLIPLGAAWSIFLVLVWNLTQNGQMAPLPYVPVLNPLDITTGFSLLLGVEAFRLLRQETAVEEQAVWFAALPWVAALAAYAWFNLILLRSVAVFMDISYQFGPMFDSQFVQTLLALVWSGTALVLMRLAAQRVWHRVWMLGAILLGIVVAKLFLVDLSNIGGLARVVSFLGVGLLMLAIGYLAPFPNHSKND